MLPPADSLEIGVEETARLLGDDSEDVIRLVDCREEDEFALCRIPGAELKPLSRFPEEARNGLLSDHDRPVVVYCHHGMRSLQATNYLRQLGYDRVWSMTGGIDAWSRDIDPDVSRY